MFFVSEWMYAGDVGLQEIETFWVWVALFALGVIGIVILFVSSRQMVKIEQMHKDMLEKQKEIERSQSLFLANISENIHEIVEKTYVDPKTRIIKEGQQPEVTKGKKLLDVTNDLIEFLRLKSKKVESTNEKFNLNNVLNEVSGSVCSLFQGSKVELIFNIDNKIPRYLVGDALNLEKSLQNLLEYVLSEVESGEVTLEIMMFGTYEEKIELQFRLSDMGAGLDENALDMLFTPVYDEESKEYKGLGLFVAKELVSLMQGELVVQSTPGKGTTFTMTLPFEMLDPTNRRNYRLPDKILTEKKVFIVDRNYNSALAIKKMFAYFRHDVKVISKEEFLKRMHNLTGYDIVILDESLFKARTIEYLKKLKSEHALKVIALNSLLEKTAQKDTDDVIDRILTKPVNQERIFELIVDLYTLKRVEEKPHSEDTTVQGALTHTGEIQETANVTQESFKDFNGMRLLIVEDDVINQKVLSNILKVSGIDITIANNGREAVNTVKESMDRFDMVLMDINMPIMDGYVATQMIRLESEFDDLPIVAFTALALESERQKIFNSGMNAYLTKPINIGKLYTVFRMYMPLAKDQTDVVGSKSIASTNTLDIEKGIGYANNNEGFYMEILHEFLDAYGESAGLFEKLVHEHRYEQVKMLCLDMKGLTGTIGAREMFELISKIHQKVLYHQEEMLPEYIDAYRKELTKLTDVIRAYLVD